MNKIFDGVRAGDVLLGILLTGLGVALMVGNISGHLGEVTDEGVRERALQYLAQASQALSDRVAESMEAPTEVGSPTA